MCTAMTYKTANHYFGRNLDLDYSYRETVTVTPRNFPLNFRHLPAKNQHYAMVGMAYLQEGYPLYYDAMNEKGLGMAGLNFPDNAVYHQVKEGEKNLAPFELIPWVLGNCETVAEAKQALQGVRLVKENFSQNLPATPLHWMIADKDASIVAEPMAEGLRIYDNPVGVLTNNPPFPVHLLWLSHFMGVSSAPPENRFGKNLPLVPYSQGMGGMGLPGDLSSSSRFVRAAFVRNNSVSGNTEEESVSQFFHMLGAVEQQRGCNLLPNGNWEITRYSSCCNLDKGIYYYKTYGNSRIHAVSMEYEERNGAVPVSYPLVEREEIPVQNMKTP